MDCQQLQWKMEESKEEMKVGKYIGALKAKEEFRTL